MADRPIEDVLEELAAQVPGEEWARLDTGEALTWTTEKPSEPGLYAFHDPSTSTSWQQWFTVRIARYDSEGSTNPLRLANGTLLVINVHEYVLSDWPDGHWLKLPELEA